MEDQDKTLLLALVVACTDPSVKWDAIHKQALDYAKITGKPVDLTWKALSRRECRCSCGHGHYVYEPGGYFVNGRNVFEWLKNLTKEDRLGQEASASPRRGADMSAPVEAGLWEENGVREVHGLGLRFKTVDELKAHGYAFAFKCGSEALAKAFAWLKDDEHHAGKPNFHRGKK